MIRRNLFEVPDWGRGKGVWIATVDFCPCILGTETSRLSACAMPTPSSCILIRRLPHNPDLPLPSRQTPGAAGYDVMSAEDVFSLAPGERRAVATGLVFELPPGVEMQVRPRSGLALTYGITLPNAPGTIDPDYRGELRVIMHNAGPASVTIRRGDRIAQLVFARFETPVMTEAAVLSDTGRGAGGFGSTGS